MYDAWELASICNSYQQLLNAILDRPGMVADRADLHSEASRKLFRSWNDTAADFGAVVSVHHLFERQAKLTPTAVAVRFAESSLQYAELNRRSNQLAHVLIRRGAAPGSVVALYLDRSLEAIVAVLGVLKAGAAYLPLDPDYPEARTVHILQESQAAFVVTEQAHMARLKTMSTALPLVDIESISFDPSDDIDPHVSLDADDLAYVIYTAQLSS